MSKVFNSIQTNVLNINNLTNNQIGIFSNENTILITEPVGSVGNTGPTGSPYPYVSVDNINSNNITIDPNIQISFLNSGTNFTLPTTNVSDGTIKYIINDNGVLSNYISVYDGSNYFNLGQGTNGSVRAIITDSQNNLYVGGDFTTAGGNSANYIAKWIPSGVNTGLWFPLGAGVNNIVRALTVDSQDNLYVGGNITTAGGRSANYIAKWIPSGVNTGLWYSLGVGVENVVYTLVVDSQDNLYVGGTFTTAGVRSAVGIAKWIPSGVNTGLWYSLGAGVNNVVYTLAVDSQDNVYVAGGFTTAGGNSANYIAKWIPSGVNTGLWFPLGAGTNITVYSLTIDSQDNLYVGGQFTTAGGNNANYVAKWIPSGVNTGLWFPLGAGVSNLVYSIAIDLQDNLYAGGNFITAGGRTAYFTAKWIPSGVNTGFYVSLTGSVNNTVYALYIPTGTNNLYLGGDFRVSNYNSPVIIRSNYFDPVSGGVNQNYKTATLNFGGTTLELMYMSSVEAWTVLNDNFSNFTIT